MEYTPEQLNYFRICYIVFNLVPEGLRGIFKQEWNFRYQTTPFGEWKDSPQNGRDFYNNETRRSRTKNARCLATIQNGNTTEWDCTCLFFVILYSDSIGTTLSPAVNKDIDDIRKVRNEVAHISEAELTDAEFHHLVSNVLAAFHSLNLSVIAAKIETIRKQTSFPTAEVKSLKIHADNLKTELMQAKADLQTKEEEVNSLTQEVNSKVESFCNLTFEPSHEIIRRSNDVTRIMKKMDDLQQGSNGAISTIYLSGNPGCGKSQVARQIGQDVFNKRSQENTGLTFVATLNAETLETLADSYVGLGRKLGITEYTLTSLATSKVSSAKETVQHLTRLIVQQMKLFSKWLIIVDNVVDLPLVRDNLPPTGSEEWGHGQILITTQDGNSVPINALHTYHESLSEGMQPDDAVQLLKQVSKIENQEKAETVAEVLDYQPLALATAAFYAQTVVSNGSPSFSWTSYLETLRSEEREATEGAFAQQNLAYSTTMTSAIKMAINRAAEREEVLRQAFCLFSVCAPDSLPIEAAVKFVKSRETSQITEELIKAKILKSPLVSCLCNEDGEPAYFRVHKIVYEVSKMIFNCDLENTDSTECLAVAIRTFHSVIETQRDQLLSSEHVCVKLRRITDHCREIHERLITSFELKDQDAIGFSNFLHFISLRDVVSWLGSVAEVCRDLSTISAASAFSSSVLEFAKYISSSQNDKLLNARALSVRGDVLLLQCKYEFALSYYERATTIHKEIYGDLGQHGDLAGSYRRLGNICRALGQYKQAKEHHEKALDIGIKLYGGQHGAVATSYNNLGTVYRDLGQYNLAKEHHEKALNITRNIYGEHHDAVASSYHNLGSVYHALGRHSQAEEHYQRALNIRRKIYGDLHGDVAASYNNVGVVYHYLRQHRQAKEHYEKALDIRRKIYDEYHGDVAASYNNLGVLCHDFGQHNQAKEHYEKALDITRKIYGGYHGDVAASYNNLGRVYRNMGLYSQAKEHYEKALSIRRKIYGEQHGAVAESYNNLGVVYRNLGQYNQAKLHHKKALNIYKKMYNGQHPDVEICSRNLRTLERSHLPDDHTANGCCIIL